MSHEREISLRSGEAVAQVLEARGHDVARVYVDHDLDLALRQKAIEVAFVALHGRYGEDGCVQGLLEMLKIPYTGSGVLASSLAMNKLKSKEIFRLHNLPTAPYYVVTAESASEVEEIHGSFGFPVVVKPCSSGSSVGVALVEQMSELVPAVQAALHFDETLLVERYLPGKEITVGILDGAPLGAVEIHSRRGLYDYRAKYTPGQTVYHCPPRISPTRMQGILRQALAAHDSLGCTGASRVDLIVSERGNEAILEVNTLPGMTETSLLPKIARSAGMEFGVLCERVLAGAQLQAGVHRVSTRRRLRQAPFETTDRRQRAPLTGVTE
jgi:D-alanine-D-alanine ligase